MSPSARTTLESLDLTGPVRATNPGTIDVASQSIQRNGYLRLDYAPSARWSAFAAGHLFGDSRSLDFVAAARRWCPEGFDIVLNALGPEIAVRSISLEEGRSIWGFLADLGLISRLQSSVTIFDTSDQIWLGPAAPPDALARLQGAGLRVDNVQSASAVLQQAQRSAPALADDFLLLATVAALLAAAASTGASRTGSPVTATAVSKTMIAARTTSEPIIRIRRSWRSASEPPSGPSTTPAPR